jgi:hypothetical protein
MAVVMTRVTPLMLPPTIITAPTSDTARPKAVKPTVSTARRSCSNISSAAVKGPAPSERSWSPPSSSASCTSRRVNAVISGSTSTACAITIAPGVKSRPKDPSGPARDSSR